MSAKVVSSQRAVTALIAGLFTVSAIAVLITLQSQSKEPQVAEGKTKSPSSVEESTASDVGVIWLDEREQEPEHIPVPEETTTTSPSTTLQPQRAPSENSSSRGHHHPPPDATPQPPAHEHHQPPPPPPPPPPPTVPPTTIPTIPQPTTPPQQLRRIFGGVIDASKGSAESTTCAHPQIIPPHRMTIRNPSGGLLATVFFQERGTKRPGTVFCEFRYSVQVPDAEYYVFQIDDDAPETVSRNELARIGWQYDALIYLGAPYI